MLYSIREYLRRSGSEHRRRSNNVLFEDETRGTEATSVTDEACPGNVGGEDNDDYSMFPAIPEYAADICEHNEEELHQDEVP